MSRILIVCSKNKGEISPFIVAQIESLKSQEMQIEIFGIKGKGVIGYLSNISKFRRIIKKNNYQLVHAHFGLSGLLANFQRIIPVITTFHGTDTYTFPNNILSIICSRLSSFNILTNDSQVSHLKLKKNYEIISCGIDLSIFKPMDKSFCRQKLGWNQDKKYILFSSSFSRPEKNAKLALEVIEYLSKDQQVELIELKGYSRNDVPVLINASDMVLITSHYETGPLIAKEALACNTPVITTNVGNMSELEKLVNNLHIVSYEPEEVANKISKILKVSDKYDSSTKMKAFGLDDVAAKIKNIYKKINCENFN